MFEQLRARRAQARYERALARWQDERDECAELLELANHFAGEQTDEIVLGRGEALFLQLAEVTLIEERASAGHYEGGYSGLSLPIGRIGGRALRYNLGASRGHHVKGPALPTAVDTGSVYLTSRRVVFIGAAHTRECAFAKLNAVRHDEHEGETSFSVSNRQRAITLRYGHELAATFAFHLELALAHQRGSVTAFVAQLQRELAELELRRPRDPSRGPLQAGVSAHAQATATPAVPSSLAQARPCERRARPRL